MHVREAPENEDAEFKLRDEEKEEGPELLTTIENDAAMEWGHMWTPLSSHSNPYAKHIVLKQLTSRAESEWIRR